MSRPSLARAVASLPGGLQRAAQDLDEQMRSAPGSSHNHQAWSGGYLDHLDEVCAIATMLHAALGEQRPLTFSLEDAWLVLWLHDVAKVLRYSGPTAQDRPLRALLDDDLRDEHVVQDALLHLYDVEVSAEQRNALLYVHGELDDYRKDRRVAGPLATFCHMCDVWSARGWYDEPRRSGSLRSESR